MTPIETVREALEGVRKSGSGWSAKCPAHEDRAPSLSISEGDDGRVLLFCHAGCPFAAIVRAAGLEEGDLFPKADENGKRIVAEYAYTDETGAELFRAVRFEPKAFRQRRREGDAWTWNLNGRAASSTAPELLEGAKAGATVYVVEGEKDVEALRSLGLVATCNPMGAGKWRDEYAEPLRGAHVVVVADKDEPGRKHAAVRSGAARRGKSASVPVVEVTEGKDAADWIARGATCEDFEKLAVTTATPVPASPWRGTYDVAGILAASSAGGPRFKTGIEALDERLTLRTNPQNVGTPLGRVIGFVGSPGAGKSVTIDRSRSRIRSSRCLASSFCRRRTARGRRRKTRSGPRVPSRSSPRRLPGDRRQGAQATFAARPHDPPRRGRRLPHDHRGRRRAAS